MKITRSLMPQGLDVDAALIPASMLNKLLTAYFTQCHSVTPQTIIGAVIDELRSASRGANPMTDAVDIATQFITERKILEIYNPDCPNEFFNCDLTAEVVETQYHCVVADK